MPTPTINPSSFFFKSPAISVAAFVMRAAVLAGAEMAYEKAHADTVQNDNEEKTTKPQENNLQTNKHNFS